MSTLHVVDSDRMYNLLIPSKYKIIREESKSNVQGCESAISLNATTTISSISFALITKEAPLGRTTLASVS